MPLRTTNTLPPGGFPYVQPETGFKPAPMMPFNNVVTDILIHREANQLPRATRAEVSDDLQEYTCQRLGNDAAYCIGGKKKDAGSSRISASPDHQRNLARPAGLKKLEALTIGAQILADWVGGGMQPVSKEKANARASVCVGCPNNQAGSRFTDGVANSIREQMEKKHDMAAYTNGEEKLETCSICLCNLRLKVWVPMKTILERTPTSMLKKFDGFAPEKCWMRTER